MATSAPKTVTVVSSDGEPLEIAESVAKQSITIRDIIGEVGSSGRPIPLFNVTGGVLIKVIEYLNNHGGGGDAEKKKKKDEELVSAPVKELFQYLMAANYLNIEGLIDLVAKKIGELIGACDSVAEMRKLVGKESDHTQQGMAEVIWENQWAFS